MRQSTTGLAARPDALPRLRRSLRGTGAIPLRLRVLDITLILVMLPVALPFGTILALAVFLDSPGPVLYRSRRIGRGGHPFDMLKFRTMTRDAPGPLVSTRRDARFTPLGRTLAHSRLDELPQLWNVLRGDMRLVGPRPEVEEFVRDFPAEYERILSVPPGLTGPSQLEFAWEGEVLAAAKAVDRVRVYREELLPYKVAMDLRYVTRHGVWMDLFILLRTLILPAVKVGRRLNALRGHAAAGAAPVVQVAAVLLLVGAIVALVGLLVAEATSPL